jgi:hypothetical protein
MRYADCLKWNAVLIKAAYMVIIWITGVYPTFAKCPVSGSLFGRSSCVKESIRVRNVRYHVYVGHWVVKSLIPNFLWDICHIVPYEIILSEILLNADICFRYIALKYPNNTHILDNIRCEPSGYLWMKTGWLRSTGRNWAVFERKLFPVHFVKMYFLYAVTNHFIFVSSCLIVSALLLISTLNTVLVRRKVKSRGWLHCTCLQSNRHK